MSFRRRVFSEETSEDVRARMHAIQDNEIHQLKDLSAFLDAELNFAEQYAEVLREIKADWSDQYVFQT